MLNRLKFGLINIGLKFISVDEKIVRMILETRPSNVNEIVILPVIKPVMKRIISQLQNKRVQGRVYNGLLNNVKVSVIRSETGAPNTATMMECFKRCNVKVVIRLDVCGGIQGGVNKITVGDVLIPKLAYCGEGTSPYYLIKYPEIINQIDSIINPISKILDIKAGNQNIYITKPDAKLKDLLVSEGKILIPNSLREADFWTIDAWCCETDEVITALKSINVEGIDMENSVLFLLGKILNIKTASILSITDLPGDSKYDMFKSNEIHPDIEKGIERVVKIVLKALPKVKNL